MQDILGKGYTTKESFPYHMQPFVPALCFTVLCKRDTVIFISRANLFRFALNTIDSKGTLQAKEANQFCNPILNKGSKVQDLLQRQPGVAWYSMTNQLLLHHLEN